MTYLPRFDAATTARWSDLVDELDRWGEAGQCASLWWRDDDAVAPTPQLDRLLRLARGVPIALAVIPGLAEPDLPAVLGANPNLAVLQHGWRHINHAAVGKKSEFPAARAAAEAAADLAAGAQLLRALFGSRFVAMLAPPWNRFAAEFLRLLAPAGIAGLSVMVGGSRSGPASHVVPVDVHVDLLAWKADRGFIGTEAALGLIVGQLRARRIGAADPAMPTGILTHHLVMDGAAAAFLEQLLAVIGAQGAARWVTAAEAMARQ